MLKKRLYYVPGLISLILLPILIILYVNNFRKNNTEYSISLSSYQVHEITNYDSSFYNYYKTPALRNYISFVINESNQKDNNLYKEIEFLARAINIGKDSIYGLKIIFNNINYNSFIQTINSCLKSNIKTYYIQGDTLFAYYITRGLYYDNQEINIPELLPPLIDNVGLMNCITFETNCDYVAWKISTYLDILKRYYPIFICLFLLIICTIRWNYKISKHIDKTEIFKIVFLFLLCLFYLSWILLREFI